MDHLAQFHKRCESGKISRKAVILLSIPFILAALFLGWRGFVHHKFERERIEWKDAALSRIADLSTTPEVIRQELEILGADGVEEEQREWIGDRVLLMTNGEYLIYTFWHGANSGFVDHLFLARGSDGHWLYSTYHFCNSLAAIRADDCPASITEFAAKYSAREFDGKSDECLQHTWPAKE